MISSLFYLLTVLGVVAPAAQLSEPAIDLSVYHRRHAYTLVEWEQVMDGDVLHYLTHDAVPYFRMYTAATTPVGNPWRIASITVASYHDQELVQEITWAARSPVDRSRMIPDMNRYNQGRPDSVTHEVLTFALIDLISDEEYPVTQELTVTLMLDQAEL